MTEAQFAPGAAIAACEDAIRVSPGLPRIAFELGRSYWIAHRDKEAVSNFVASVDAGYGAAKSYLGDAYYRGRGLPSGIDANPYKALKWYKEALASGYSAAQTSIEIVERDIRRSTFDANKFQGQDFMRALYEGNYATVDSPVALSYYIQGVVHRLDDSSTLFMDQTCKSYLNALGNIVIDSAQLLAIAKEILASQHRTSTENGQALVEGVKDFSIEAVTSRYSDLGDRDATVLFNKDIYGCESPVAQKILSNIVLRITPSTTTLHSEASPDA